MNSDLVKQVSDVAWQIFFYAALNSIMTYGLMISIKSALQKRGELTHLVRLPPVVGISITYALGMVMSCLINHTAPWQKILYGLAIGSVSTAIYKSVIQSVLNMVPNIFSRIFPQGGGDGKV